MSYLVHVLSVDLSDSFNSTIMSSQQVAIITGAADGIGKAVALRLASDGYDVVVADLPLQRALIDAVAELVKETTGRKAISYEVDITKEDQVKAMIHTAVENLGSLDVVRLTRTQVVFERISST